MAKSKRIYVLGVSGGLDSFIFYHYLLKVGFTVFPIYFKHGNRQQEKELSKVKSMYPNISVVEIKLPTLVINSKSDFIPARNMIFLANLQSQGRQPQWPDHISGKSDGHVADADIYAQSA